MDLMSIGLLVLGLVVGTIQAATGVGWGVITVPALFLIPGIKAQEVVAVSMLASLSNTSIASFENIRHGNMNWRYAVLISAGAIVGGFIGAYFLRNLPGIAIRRAVGLVAIVAGVRLLIVR
ncbi:MAG: hypothetical protein CMH76_05010 [Nitrospinae bacterium]|nr:hypothetical protein [Nitrospinota bacterium]